MWASELSEPVRLTPTSEGVQKSTAASGLLCGNSCLLYLAGGQAKSVYSLHSKAFLKFSLG